MLPTIITIASVAAIRPLRVRTLLSAVVALVICGGFLYFFDIFVLVDDANNITR